jgi:hypothetical protein
VYTAFWAEYEGHDVPKQISLLFRISKRLSSQNGSHVMGLKDKLRKFCVMKSVRDKAKEESDDKKE